MKLPIALELSDRKCVVIGKSEEADLRCQRLSDLGANVIHILPDDFDEPMLSEAWLVILADRNEALAKRIDNYCSDNQTLYCPIDQPTYGNFSHMALVHADPVTFAISTDGQAPALARRLQLELRKLFTNDSVIRFFKHLAELRRQTPPDKRRQVLQDAMEGLELEAQLKLPAHSNSGNASSGSGAG